MILKNNNLMLIMMFYLLLNNDYHFHLVIDLYQIELINHFHLMNIYD